MIKWKAEVLTNRVKETLDLAVKQQFDSLDSLAHVSQDDLEGYKALNELAKAFDDYCVSQAEAIDEINTKLEDINDELIKINEIRMKQI